MSELHQSSRRILTGKVVSNKPENGKTVVVEVERRVLHPKYRKTVRKSSRHHAHDEDNSCNVGDVIRIQESRPYSKKKRWIVLK